MKNALLLIFLSFALSGITQTKPVDAIKPDCDSLFRAGDSHLRRQNLQQALQCYLGAMNCDTRLAGKVGPKIEEVFGRIERQRRSEVEARIEADSQRVKAIRNEVIADNKKIEAANLARSKHANDLIYKSKLALLNGDRNTAFRLAEFAHRYVDPYNDNVTRALIETYYYNDHPDSTHRLNWNLSLEGHSESITCFAFSPDHLKIATGSGDNTIRIWDISSAKTIKILERQSLPVTCLAFSPDGKWLASGSEDATVILWDAKSAKVIRELKPDTLSISWGIDSQKELFITKTDMFITGVAFSPDSKNIAASFGHETGVFIWDLEDGSYRAKTLFYPYYPLEHFAFSTDLTRFVSKRHNDTLEVWDVNKKKVIVGFDVKNLEIHDIVFSHKGDKLAAIIGDKSVFIWDIQDKTVQTRLADSKSTINAISFSPDGKYIATVLNSCSIKINDMITGNEVMMFDGLKDTITDLVFSLDGKKLAARGTNPTIKVWELQYSKEARILNEDSSPIWSIDFSPDGKKIALASITTAKIWEFESASPPLVLENDPLYFGSIAFSPDGKSLAITAGPLDEEVVVRNLDKGSIVLRITDTVSFDRVAFSPNGQILATGSKIGKTKIWNPVSGDLIRELDDRYSTGIIAFSPNGKRLATGSYDSGKIWDVENGQLIMDLKGTFNGVTAIDYSLDGKWLATGSHDNTVRIWDMTNGYLALSLKGHTDNIRCVSFSPNGRWLSTGSFDNSVKIWDLRDGKVWITLNGHERPIRCVAFSPDGDKLATTSDDKTLKIWLLNPNLIIDAAHSSRKLAALSSDMLNDYNLDDLLGQPYPVPASTAMSYSNEEKLLIGTGDVWQIVAFADFAVEQAKSVNVFHRMEPFNARARRLYKAALSLSSEPIIIHKYISLLWLWSESAQLNGYDKQASELDGEAFQLCFLSEKAHELWKYADYYYKAKKWHQAGLLYEKAEQIQHSPILLLRLFKVAQKLESYFDIERFMSTRDYIELLQYGDYFHHNDLWLIAVGIYEKADKLFPLSPKVLIKLHEMTQKTGHPFDFQRFLSSNAPDELTQYATYFLQKTDTLPNYRDRIRDYSSALLLREKQLTLDTTSATRLKVANEYNSLAFFQLFLPDGAAAEASLRRAYELDPTNKFIPTNRAPALLLQGRWTEAEAEYRKWKDVEFGENDLPTYREAFLADLEELEAQGVTHPDFEKARALLKQE